MNKHKKIILSSIAAMMLGLTGCQSSNTIQVTNNNQTVVIPKSPKKIVVMNYGALDTLDALGKGSLVVGTSASSLPNYLNQYKKTTVIDTGKMKEPNVATIKASNPDLIIIGGRQARQINELSKIAPVINLDSDPLNYLESTKQHIALLGKITGSNAEATKLIQSLDNKVHEAQKVTESSNKKAIVVMHNDGKVMLTNTGARPTLIHDVLKVKRAVPATSQVLNTNQRPKPILIDNNYIANVKPDVIYIIDRSKAIGGEAMSKNYFDKKILAKTKTKLVYLTADTWYLSGDGAESLPMQIDEVINALK